MPERLKAAIEKAREARGALYEEPPAPSEPAGTLRREGGAPKTSPARDAKWEALGQIELDPKSLRRNRIVTYQRSDPAHYSFDVLRTRILRMFRENGWTRLGVTSPTLGCGKTMFSANLALSFARQSEQRVLLADMDMRSPRLADYLGVKEERPLEWFLAGQTPAAHFLKRVGDNMAVCLNSKMVRHSAEVTQSERTARTLAKMHDEYRPDVSIYDLPPLLYGDDAFAFLPNVDCVILIVAAGRSKATEIDECERLLSENSKFLGVILNKSKEKNVNAEMYGY